jgi:hypothetical protein
MNLKYKLQILNENGEIENEESYRTFKDISNKYNIDLHIVREINKICDNKKVQKFSHSQNNEIYKRFKIFKIIPKIEDGVITYK